MGLFVVSALAVGVTAYVAVNETGRALAGQQARTAEVEAAALRQQLTSRLEDLRRQVRAFAAEAETLRVVQDGGVLEVRARRRSPV